MLSIAPLSRTREMTLASHNRDQLPGSDAKRKRSGSCSRLSRFLTTDRFTWPGTVSRQQSRPISLPPCTIQLSQPVESSTVGDKSSNAGKERKNGLAAVLLIGPLGRRRALLNGAYSFVFIGVMHGAHAVFPLALVCGTFVLGHTFKGSRLAQVINWTAAIILVWLKERWYHEFTFERLLGEDFAGLDAFSGMHPWRLSFNLVILRIVSFNLDLHWAELERMESGAGWTSGQEVGGVALVRRRKVLSLSRFGVGITHND